MSRVSRTICEWVLDVNGLTKSKRVVAVLLIALGAVMLLAAPATVGGLIAIAAGVAIEIVGITLEKRR